jgi:hypothetical protein
MRISNQPVQEPGGYTLSAAACEGRAGMRSTGNGGTCTPCNRMKHPLPDSYFVAVCVCFAASLHAPTALQDRVVHRQSHATVLTAFWPSSWYQAPSQMRRRLEDRDGRSACFPCRRQSRQAAEKSHRALKEASCTVSRTCGVGYTLASFPAASERSVGACAVCTARCICWCI